jgi:hypothetical protein
MMKLADYCVKWLTLVLEVPMKLADYRVKWMALVLEVLMKLADYRLQWLTLVLDVLNFCVLLPENWLVDQTNTLICSGAVFVIHIFLSRTRAVS